MGSNIKQFISSLPEMPGIYKMLNVSGKVIYIGKAKVLKNRIRSYFSKKGEHSSPKVNIMSNHIVDVDWIVVRDEKEALLTEANMIKEHRPKYNVLLKDDLPLGGQSYFQLI